MNHYLDLPGHGRIHAESEGTGPAIVFVHADFVDGRMWDGVRALLAARFQRWPTTSWATAALTPLQAPWTAAKNWPPSSTLLSNTWRLVVGRFFFRERERDGFVQRVVVFVVTSPLVDCGRRFGRPLMMKAMTKMKISPSSKPIFASDVMVGTPFLPFDSFLPVRPGISARQFFCAILSFALLALWLAAISSSPGTIGFFVRIR